MRAINAQIAAQTTKPLCPPPSSEQEKQQWEGEMFRLLVENVKDYAILLVDPQGKVVSWSKGAERLLGYTEKEIIGQPISILFTPEDIARGEVEREMRTAIEKGRGEDDRWHIRKNGSRFWCSGVLTPLKDGTLRGFAKIMRDLTAQKQHEEYQAKAEAALREQANLLDLATVFARRLDGAILYWTKGCEAMYGYTKEEAVGANCNTILKTKFPMPREEFYAGLLRMGWWQGELIHTRKDGSEITVASRWILHEQREPATIVEAVTDITAQKKLQGSLEQANKNKDEFLAMLAHELRNPLAPLLTAIHILRHQGVEEGFQQQTVSMVERQVRHMSRLVDDLLEVARIGRGKIKLKKEPVELNPLLLRAVESSRPVMEERKHQLSLSLPNEAMYLTADPTRLEQIISNLLNNAAKYTDEGGRIWLTAYRDEEWAVIKVKDNGIGIDAKMLPQVFELFKQGERALDRSLGGLGVGLTLVRRLVELHDGTVEAASAGVDQGSEFTVRLPLLSITTAPQGPPSERQRQVVGLPLRIMVVDDNRDAAESIRLLLTLTGHEVLTVHTGPAAIEEATRWRPDVMLLDIGLPGIDGYEVARRLRERSDMAKLVIVAITGYGQEADRQHSKEAGFQYHLVKPVSLQDVEDVLAVVALEKKDSGDSGSESATS
jgi:PAS domain S-box-containing protein